MDVSLFKYVDENVFNYGIIFLINLQNLLTFDNVIFTDNWESLYII